MEVELLMSKTIKVSGRPTEKEIEWFVKNIGPRNHYLANSIGGRGWRFHVKEDQPNPWWSPIREWYLTMDDEKMLMYWMLLK